MAFLWLDTINVFFIFMLKCIILKKKFMIFPYDYFTCKILDAFLLQCAPIKKMQKGRSNSYIVSRYGRSTASYCWCLIIRIEPYQCQQVGQALRIIKNMYFIYLFEP